jgi:hypothetical protein
MTNNKQQTVVDRIVNLLNKEGFAPVLTEEEIKSFKEMEKEQKISDFTDGYLYRGEQLRPWLIDKWYNETYGGGDQ